ncbi:S-adenosyl-L-methionine-dependent methyltransferase [Aureobasidium subglaciale]|nr:S-adenosyl-L-methionine-dependent methyltransferase [Aureobasidium subglaciale]
MDHHWQEYPWDIGIFSNVAQGMGSWNPLAWFWPFSFTPSVESGLEFEDNGLEAPGTTWPPPDPDRMFRMAPTEKAFGPSKAFTHSMDPEEFYKRQQADRLRPHLDADVSELRRRQPFHVRYDQKNIRKRREDDYVYDNDNDYKSDGNESEDDVPQWQPKPGEGEEGWRNSEGERLDDFGVDEDVEFYDEDDVPLAAAGFVPKLTTTVLSYLSPNPNDKILDIGCGDGPLTAQIAASLPQGHIFGLDASPSFIETAKEKHSSQNCVFQLQDCRHIAECAEAVDGSWDKVFSNAALHWILREPSTRDAVFKDVHSALKPGGTFVFEMGGKGNVEAVHATILSVLVANGIALSTAREACPWFFPSDTWMTQQLQKSGFEVVKCELEYRPTKCTPRSADGSGGLEGWVKLMGAEMLNVVGESKRGDIVKQVCDVLETVVTREEDGSQYLNYVRLRAVARKI